MKKSLFAAALLFSVDSFSSVYVNSSGCYSPTSYFDTVHNIGSAPSNGAGWMGNPACNEKYRGQMYGNLIIDSSQSIGYTDYPTNSGIFCNASLYNKVTVSCPSCGGGIWDNNTQSCTVPPLSAFNNDSAGCKSAGGYWFNDNTCVSGTDAIQKVFTDPTALIGGLVFINGAAWSIAGAYALPITGGASSAAIAYGGHAMAGGLGMIGVSALGQMWQSNDTPSSDFVAPDSPTRIKVKLQSDNSTIVAQGDISSGKVESISYIPPEVKQRILEGVVNPTTGLPNITQADLAGTTVTKYNYSTNTATTETIKSDGTTVTTSTPITPISNSDGTVTAQSHNESIAPTVTGTKSTPIQVPEWNQYQTIAQWTETVKTNSGTGTTSGGGSTGTTPVNTGDTTADALLNADMPSYDMTGTGEFDTLDKSVVEDMKSSVSGLFDNFQNQIDAAQLVYDQTSNLISGGWVAPQIPSGECGTTMSMDFNGKHIDVCPPLANFLSPISPLISFLITLAGTAFAISIFLGGF